MLYVDTRGGMWAVRFSVNGETKQLTTAHPLPRAEKSAAKIHALYDLRLFTQAPQNTELVWIASSGEVLEVYSLTQ